MSEKGGKEKEELTAVDGKMILTAIIGVLLGMVFVLTLIFTGIIISERYHGQLKNGKYEFDGSYVADIIAIDYETKSYSYLPERAYGETNSRALFKELGVEEDYYVINSKTKYDKAVEAITKLGGSVVDDGFTVSDDFFYSGSIIMVAAESEGLSYFGINTITRDESYNIFIDTSTVSANDTTNLAGKAVFVKIPNIQPTHVELKERNE